MNSPVLNKSAIQNAFSRFVTVPPSLPAQSTENSGAEAEPQEATRESAALRVNSDRECPYCQRDGKPSQMKPIISSGVNCYVCMDHRHVAPARNP